MGSKGKGGRREGTRAGSRAGASSPSRTKSATGKLRGDPARVRELFSRAVTALRAGDGDLAAELLTRADALAPGNASIRFNLGYAHHLAGRFDEAVDCYRDCLAAQPDNVDGWRNLFAAARAAGNMRVAIDAGREVVGRAPADMAARNDLANVLAASGAFDEALAFYRDVLARDPSRHETRRNLAQTHAMAGDAAAAEVLFRELLDTDSGDHASRALLVDLLEGQNRVDEAEEVLRGAPGGAGDVDALLRLGNLQLRQGEVADAEDSYSHVLARQPGHPVAQNNLALVRAMRGDRDGAERLLRRVIGEQPAYLEPWRNLVALRTCRDPDDPDIRAMLAIESAGGLSDDARMQLAFALGKALDDCGRHDEAFEHFRIANELRRRQAPFDAAALADHARRIRDVFDRDFLAERASWGSDSMLPVMIVGMPRTGTTLLEQILSAHPAFHGAGELLLINRLIARLERPAPGGEVRAYPERVRELDFATVDALARDYLAALRKLAPDEVTLRVGDKMPYNFFHLGLVRLLFPRGRIIHMRRHPLDACVSAYFNYFPRGLDFTSSFEDLAAFYGIYDDMMAHWRDGASVDFLDVFYEELVADPREQIARVLDHLDLPWTDELLEFHSLRRDVRTLSAWQVRRPLNTDSRERWRRYESHIGPLAAALDSYLARGWPPR